MFSIFYSDGRRDGINADDWRSHPVDRVQAVVLWKHNHYLGWSGVPRVVVDDDVVADRHLWTGLDEYDPFGWGIKYGSLIDDRAYLDIYKKAAGDPWQQLT